MVSSMITLDLASKMTGTNVLIENCKSGLRVSTITVGSQSNLTLTNSIFKNNQASE